MNKLVEKVVNKYVEKMFINNGKRFVEKTDFNTFPYKSTILMTFFQKKTTINSTSFKNYLSLLKTSFTHYPHSLLLLLLNN